MQKALKSIAMFFVLVLFAGMLSGCVAMIELTAIAVTGAVEVAGALAEGAGAIADEARAAEYRKAAEKVRQYDEVDTF